MGSVVPRVLTAGLGLIACGFVAAACAPACPAAPCTLDRATGTTIDPAPLIAHSDGSVRWNLATDRLAYDRAVGDGHYRVFVSRSDGTDAIALTDRPDLPPGHHGAPFWHPSGRYLMFVAQKPEWHGARMFGSPDYGALPGFGCHDDIWLIAADGSGCWQLTNDPDTPTEGDLLPIFSPNGRLVVWSSRQPDKTYAIRVADFVETPKPHLANIRDYRPGGRAYYEPGSFTSDSESLLYTSDQDTHSFWASQIYRLDLATGRSVRLTRGGAYNEHPVTVRTPSGDWVVYMSDKGVKRRPHTFFLGTDWWAMRVDGTGAKRLTQMNLPGANNPEDFGRPMVGCVTAIGPDGTYMLGGVQDSIVRQTGVVLVVHFTAP